MAIECTIILAEHDARGCNGVGWVPPADRLRHSRAPLRNSLRWSGRMAGATRPTWCRWSMIWCSFSSPTNSAY